MVEIFAILGGALNAAAKVGEFILTPIGRRFGYMINYNSNIDNLRNQVEKLENTRVGLQLSVDADRRNLQVIGPDVVAWLTSADEIKTEAEKILEDTVQVQNGCVHGLCPNLKSRYALSRKAKKKTPAIVELQADGKFERVSYPPPPPLPPPPPPPSPPLVGMGSTSTGGDNGFESRISTMREVMDALKDANIQMIGICGMGGIGKTTMVKDVAQRVKTGNLFDEVVMTAVSQQPDLKKIQRNLAELLGLKLEDESEFARASRLRERLKDVDRVLVILDDVWARLDLADVGIPSGTDHKGCKVVLTSRIQDVCNEMGTEKNIAIEVLPDDEAWKLFEEMVGESVENPDLQKIAKEVANECGGLPISLVTIGKALRNKNRHVWNDALRQLRRPSGESSSEVNAKVYRSLELSYNFLDNKEAKSLFLLCCLFQEDYDIPIEELVRLGMGLRLFSNIDELGEARDRVCALLDKLKSCHLLLKSDVDHHVKMHDAVRDVAISIASKDDHVFMVQHGVELREWPKNRIYNHYNSISVIADTIHEFPQELECKKLKLLMLTCKNDSLKRSYNFFVGMRKLEVLTLSGMPMQLLPSSLWLLRNLQTLGLHSCQLKDIAIIGELVNLEILSFRGSSIEVLPEKIGRLTNLRLLDLLECKNLQRISPGVISGLVQLQELYMRDSFKQWEAEEGKGRRNATLTELESLPHLSTVDIHIPDAALLPRNPSFENLVKYKISVGDFNYYNDYDCSRFRYEKHLVLIPQMPIPLENGIDKLLKSAELLHLEGEGSENAVQELLQDGQLQNLRDLTLVSCDTPECLANTMYWDSPSAVFPVLESLELQNLPNLKEICHGQFPVGSLKHLRGVTLYHLPALTHFLVEDPTQTTFCLSNLRSVRLLFCDRLRNLFSQSIARGLLQLQKLSIGRCDMMEEVVWKEMGEDGNSTDKIVFPELEFLELKNLPSLNGFSRGIDEMEFPKLATLHFESLPKIKNFCPRNSNLAAGDNFNAALRSIFPPKVAFPSLEVLELRDFDHLEGMVPEQLPAGSFSKLRKILVEECNKLLKAIPSCLLSRLQNLEELIIEGCRLLEKVFELEGLHIKEGDSVMLSQLKSVKLKNLPKLNYISKREPMGYVYFPGLRVLHVHGCDNLRYLFSQDMVINSMAQLEELEICECKMMSVVVAEGNEQGESSMVKIEFPKLKFLKLESLPNLESFYSKVKVIDEGSREELSGDNLQNPMQPLFNENVTLPNLENLELCGLQNVKEIWSNQLLIGSFGKLKALNVKFCSKLTNVIPSQMLILMPNLEDVTIWYCGSVEEVFGEVGELTTAQLRKLTLIQLYGLTQICKNDHHGVLFKKLSLLIVKDCSSLTNLFSQSMVKALAYLQELTVYRCFKMEEIVKEEGGEGKIDKILFPRLKYLKLKSLLKLRSFCSISCTLELPMLERVAVLKCPKMETFSQEYLSTPKLREVKLKEGQPWLLIYVKETDLWTDVSDWEETEAETGDWRGELNDTIHYLFTQGKQEEEEEQQQQLQPQPHSPQPQQQQYDEKVEDKNGGNDDDNGDGSTPITRMMATTKTTMRSFSF
ncbi:hypothetical protein ACSBR2_034428 [Camellia fascicularis]